MKTKFSIATILLIVVFYVSSVSAQQTEDYHPFLTNKFSLGVGAYFPDKDFNIRVDGSVSDQEIDFDEALKHDTSNTTSAINFRWRFGEKWSVAGQYWSLNSNGGAILEQDIEWEDVVFKEGTFANGGAGTTVGRIFFGRVFSSSTQHEFGLGMGFHWLELDTFLEGEIIVNENTTEFQRVAVDASFPLPNIGAWYMYSWSPKWLFETRVDWLSASIGDYSGGILNASAGINYQAFKNSALASITTVLMWI